MTPVGVEAERLTVAAIEKAQVNLAAIEEASFRAGIHYILTHLAQVVLVVEASESDDSNAP